MENSNGTTGRIVNIDYLRQLSKGNTRFVEEMIRIFLSENPEEIRTLELAVRKHDYDLVKATTHKLRSTLPYIGLDKLVENEISEIEDLATNRRDIDRIQELCLKVKGICDQACQELQPV